jgi:RHS repeat-associated protein
MTGITFGYQGQRFDAETGLYYYKARHYSPKLGRFLQPDSVGYRGGFNLYTYVLNDPLNRTDPYGLAPTTNPQQNKFIPGGGGVSLPPPDTAPPDVNGFSIDVPFVTGPNVVGPILIFNIHMENQPPKPPKPGKRPDIHKAATTTEEPPTVTQEPQTGGAGAGQGTGTPSGKGTGDDDNGNGGDDENKNPVPDRSVPPPGRGSPKGGDDGVPLKPPSSPGMPAYPPNLGDKNTPWEPFNPDPRIPTN